jgi:hypothetical protein
MSVIPVTIATINDLIDYLIDDLINNLDYYLTNELIDKLINYVTID